MLLTLKNLFHDFGAQLTLCYILYFRYRSFNCLRHKIEIIGFLKNTEIQITATLKLFIFICGWFCLIMVKIYAAFFIFYLNV